MAPKRTLHCFFKKVDKDGHIQSEQNNSPGPVVCPQSDDGAVVVETPNPEEHMTTEEAPTQPAPKVPRVNAEIADASVLIVERDPGLRRQIWEYPANERDQVRKVYIMNGAYQFHMDTYPVSEDHVWFEDRWMVASLWMSD
jgi:hypothetical protein